MLYLSEETHISLGGLDCLIKIWKEPGSGLMVVKVSFPFKKLPEFSTNCATKLILFLVSYTNWKSGDPSGEALADCVSMISNGRWDDVACDGSHRMYPYICEKGTKTALLRMSQKSGISVVSYIH